MNTVARRSMWTGCLLWLNCTALLGQNPSGISDTAALRLLVEQSSRLALDRTTLKVAPLRDGWALGMVSWIAVDPAGVIYLLQRGQGADPVVAVDRGGRVLRSWGRGMYTMPHSIRIDPEGNIWTTDAASSKVLKFTPQGKRILEISVGGQPEPCPGNFCGTTDVAFAPNRRVFVSDGYANARILEYTPDGKKVREWGTPGDGPGQFRIPHSIAVDQRGVLYVADRENGRIQRFTLGGDYLGAWPNLGKTMSLKMMAGALWAATQPRDQPNGAPGWLIRIDPRTGAITGHVDSVGSHGMEATDAGELFVAPGPNQLIWLQRPR